MNEIEIEKNLIKDAFSKKQLPSFGIVDGGSTVVNQTVRNYIWQVAGYLQGEKCPKGFGANKTFHTKSKKIALLMLYRLWSGFTKNLRYTLTQKGAAKVNIDRFGFFSRCKSSDSDAFKFKFTPNQALSQHLNSDQQPNEGEVTERESSSICSVDWLRIAQSAQIPNQDMAKVLIQTIFAMALQQEQEGNHVTLNMKIGRLTLVDGKIKFTASLQSNR